MSPAGLRAFVKQPQLQFVIISRQFWGLEVRGFDRDENFFHLLGHLSTREKGQT